MIKLVGASFILMTTTWLGFQQARRYAERPRQIRQLRSALSLLKTDIGYGTRPLVQVFEKIAHREQGIVAGLFQTCAYNLQYLDGSSTYECFKQALEKEWKKTVMKDPEKEILLDFGRTLGISDREDQLQHIAVADTNLKIEELRAREEQLQYEKMYKTMGVLSGALIVILIC